MKKIAAIVCLLISSILLGGYFENQDFAEITALKKEVLDYSLLSKVYVLEDDLDEILITRDDDEYGEVYMYSLDSLASPYILTWKAAANINVGERYAINYNDEVRECNGYIFQVYSLSEPKSPVLWLISSAVFMALFAILMLWGHRDELIKKKH